MKYGNFWNSALFLKERNNFRYHFDIVILICRKKLGAGGVLNTTSPWIRPCFTDIIRKVFEKSYLNATLIKWKKTFIKFIDCGEFFHYKIIITKFLLWTNCKKIVYLKSLSFFDLINICINTKTCSKIIQLIFWLDNGTQKTLVLSLFNFSA